LITTDFFHNYRTILGNLLEQACISEPARIIHYAFYGNFQFRGMERGSESARGTGLETVNTTDERTGEKESPAAECNDYNQQRDDDGLSSGAADNGLNGGDDDLNDGDDDDLHGSDDDDRSSYDDYDDNEEEVDQGPPPSLSIRYDGDSYNMKIAYSFSRYLVEVLSVRPRFPFEGTFLAFNDCSAYYFRPQNDQLHRNVDTQVLSMHFWNGCSTLYLFSISPFESLYLLSYIRRVI
jgi:hypothetical protein